MGRRLLLTLALAAPLAGCGAVRGAALGLRNTSHAGEPAPALEGGTWILPWGVPADAVERAEWTLLCVFRPG